MTENTEKNEIEKIARPFDPVTDVRGHTIRGLWIRNGRYYVQMRLPGKNYSQRVPLKDENGLAVQTTPQAQMAVSKLLLARHKRQPIVVSSKKLGEWVDYYLDYVSRTNLKKKNTIQREKASLCLWKKKLGHVRLIDLQPKHINDHLIWRKEAYNLCGRTLNLDVTILNNALRLAVQERQLIQLPTLNREPIPHKTPERPLWPEEKIRAICDKAREVCHNGDLLSDFIWFLAFSGSRRNGALNVKWSDIDWENRQLKITSKFDTVSIVDFNHRLEGHLKDMLSRRVDSEYLFPGFRENGSARACVMQASLQKARGAAEAAGATGVSDLQFHDLRHFFISSMVMSGIDFMTISLWVGHKDGGKLICDVYGHLNDAHKKTQATKAFGGKKIEEEPILKVMGLLQTQLAEMQAQNRALMAQIAKV